MSSPETRDSASSRDSYHRSSDLRYRRWVSDSSLATKFRDDEVQQWLNQRSREMLHESLVHASRARGGRPADPHRPGRRRQVRHHVPVAGAADAGHAPAGPRRPDAGARQGAPDGRGLAEGADRGQVAGRRAEDRQDLRHRRRHGRDRAPRDRRGDRGDRRSGHRHQAVPGGDRARQAHRHGQRRGGRAGGAAAGAAGAGGGRGLLAGLGRPAGADLRARRLGARLRVQGGRRRQGHALSPDLPPVHARHGVGHPRPVPADQGPQPHQSEDVQLVRRRHQVGHRDDGGVQRHGAGAADERAGLSAGVALRAGRRVQAARAKAARWRRRA